MAVHSVTAKDINALAGRDYTETGRGGAVVHGLLAGLVTRLGDWWRYRTTVTELSYLTDRQLADIGLMRSDISVVARAAARRAGA